MRYEDIPGTRLGKLAAAAVVALAAGASPAAWAAQPPLKTVHTYAGTPDGALPMSSPVRDAAGNFYGLTFSGGLYDYGTVYELIPQGGGKVSYKRLYDVGGADGQANPMGRPVIGSDGHLYFATNGDSTVGHGGIIELVPGADGHWSLGRTTLFDGTDGSGPNGLTQGPGGLLYGTAHGGGQGNIGFGYGTVFSVDVSGAQLAITPIWTFQYGADGGFPDTDVLPAADGTLYGVEPFGGNFSVGTFWKLTPSASGWQKTTLYSFTNGADGMDPRCDLTVDAKGNFYTCGSVSSDGVHIDYTNVVELSPAGGGLYAGTTIYQTLINGTDPWSFTGVLAAPNDTLIVTADWGGTGGDGALVQLTPNGGSWTPADIHDFSGTDGTNPFGQPEIGPGRVVVGVTYRGGASNDGTVYGIKF